MLSGLPRFHPANNSLCWCPGSSWLQQVRGFRSGHLLRQVSRPPSVVHGADRSVSSVGFFGLLRLGWLGGAVFSAHYAAVPAFILGRVSLLPSASFLTTYPGFFLRVEVFPVRPPYFTYFLHRQYSSSPIFRFSSGPRVCQFIALVSLRDKSRRVYARTRLSGS